jgi:hypothetical protein
LALLEAIQHELDAARNSQLFKDPEQVVSDDSGSSVLGFVIALLGLAFCRESGPAKSPLLFSLLVAALPLLDALFAVLRRIRHRASPFYGDRRHCYDLQLARGWTARRVALTCYALTAGLVIAGWTTLRLENREAIVASAVVGSGLLVIAVRMGALRSQDESQNERVKADVRWREMADRRLHQKI